MKPQRTMLTDDGELRETFESEDSKAPETIYCTQCGSNNLLGSHFCRNCGSSLDEQVGTYPKPKRSGYRYEYPDDRPRLSRGLVYEVFKLVFLAIVLEQGMKLPAPQNYIILGGVLIFWLATEVVRYIFK